MDPHPDITKIVTRRGKRTGLTPTRLKMLAHILHAADRGHALTLRELGDLCGVSFGRVASQLSELRHMGLISYEYDRCGTIRPTCRMEIFVGDDRR